MSLISIMSLISTTHTKHHSSPSWGRVVCLVLVFQREIIIIIIIIMIIMIIMIIIIITTIQLIDKHKQTPQHPHPPPLPGSVRPYQPPRRHGGARSRPIRPEFSRNDTNPSAAHQTSYVSDV